MKTSRDIVNDEIEIYKKEKKKKKEEKKEKEKVKENEKEKDNDKEEQKKKEDNESRSDKLLFKDILKDEDDDDDDSRVILKNGEDFVEKDGEKFVDFSLENEKKKGHFDKNGNYIPDQEEEEENEENHTYSTETEDDEDSSKMFLTSLEKLISLIPPQNNAQEALQASGKNNDRLIAITDCATNLLSLGEIKIYTESLDELTEKLKNLKK